MPPGPTFPFWLFSVLISFSAKVVGTSKTARFQAKSSEMKSSVSPSSPPPQQSWPQFHSSASKIPVGGEVPPGASTQDKASEAPELIVGGAGTWEGRRSCQAGQPAEEYCKYSFFTMRHQPDSDAKAEQLPTRAHQLRDLVQSTSSLGASVSSSAEKK